MTLSHFTKVYGSKKASIAALLTDPAGGSATYAASTVVPGIQQVAISGTVDSKELRGDNTLLDSDAVLHRIDVTIDWAKFNFDILATILGWTVVDAGTTPNQTVTADLVSPVSLGYFKLDVQAVTSDVIGGDIHFILPKLKISSFPDMGTAQEDYRLQKVQAIAVPLISTSKWITVQAHETAAAPA